MDTGGPEDATQPAELRDPLLGRMVGGKFLLEQMLGEGAMGAVYKARQVALEKVVAIKVMHAELARDTMFAGRFHREAKAASRLDHPNSIGIIDFGEDPDGLLYIAMEFLDGRDLAHIIHNEWPLPYPRVVDILSQALGAISVAHEMGITHRDLKPENIMVLGRRTDDDAVVDVVKVCDFGIAKLVEAEEPGDPSKGRGKLTTAGLVIGTPAYMSPEQGRGEQIDGRSDLYSVGVILFQLLTGQLPFDAPSPIGIVVKHQSEPVPIPSTIRPGVSKELEAICLRALAKSPAERYQTAKELRAALRHVSDAGIPSHDLSVASLPVVRTGSARLVTGNGLAGGGETAETQAMVATTAPAPVVTAPALTASAAAPAARTPRVLLPGSAVALVVGVGLFLGLRQHGVARSHEPAPRADPEPRIAMVAEPPPRYVPPEPSSAPAPSANAPSSVPQVHERATPKAEPYVRGPARAGQVDPGRAPEPPKKEESLSMPVPTPPPSVVTLPPSPPPLPVTPPPVAPPPFELASASVAVGSPSNLTHTSGTAVNAALSRMKPAITGCYKSALPSLSAPLEGSGTLHIETDDEGNITRAQLAGPVRGQAGSCIEGVVRGVTIRGVDTGAASADIPLEFKAR